MKRLRWIRVVLLTTTICGTPGLAQADPVSLTALAATAAGAAIQGAISSAILGSVLGAIVTAGLSFLGQQLFSPNQASEQQRSVRTRKFETHPPFRFALGTVPLEGSVVFHYVVGETYYVAYLLNSILSHPKCVEKLVINDVIELDVPGLQEPEFADYNGVLVLQDIYDMELGAGAQGPGPYGVSDAPDLKFWCGTGTHTQCPQQWLDEIGPNGTAEAGVLKASDVWEGHTVLFARYVDDNPKLAGERYSHGRPPPLRVHGKWSRLYDPRLDPTSGVTQLGQVAISMALTAPPGSPADGDTYVVAATATGDWATHEDEIAVWDATGGAWQFTAPTDGQTIWNLADHARHAWNASTPAWELDRAGHDFDDETTWEWSQNASLAALTVSTHAFGLGFETEIIPIQQVADAADDVDAEFSAEASILLTGDNQHLRLHFDGPASSTTITDSSVHNRSPSLVKNVALDGSGGAVFSSGDTFLTGIQYDDLEVVRTAPSDGEFRYEIDATVTSLSAARTYFGDETGANIKSVRLQVLTDGTLKAIFWGEEGNVGTTTSTADSLTLTSAAGVIGLSTRHVIRLERLNDDWYLRVDGNTVAEDLSHPFTVYTGSSSLAEFKLGRHSNNLGQFIGTVYEFGVWIDGVPQDEDVWGCNGLLVVKQREIGLLDPILNTMAGQLDTTDGLLGWRAGVWKAPTETLVQPSAGTVRVKGARDAGFDTVRASFISSLNDWEETDGPGYQLRTGARVHPLELPFVAGHEQAAMLEKRFAERAEPLHEVTGTWDPEESDRRIGERVNFSLFGLDRTNSTYAVTAKRPVIEQLDDGAVRHAVELTLEEDLEASYSWTTGDYTRAEEITPAKKPSSNFGPPTSVVAAQQNYAGLDGGSAAARLAVAVTLSAAVAGSAGAVEIEVNDGGGWVSLATLSVESSKTEYVAYRDPVLVGVTYQARARTLRSGDAGGHASDWVLSNSVTIVEPLLDYDHADYSGEYA